MGLPSEEVCAARMLLPSLLGGNDPVRMVIVFFTVRLNFVSCDITIGDSHVFALYHVNIVVWMQRTELRAMSINIVAFVIEELCSGCPYPLQWSVSISFATPIVKDREVLAVVMCTSR